MLPLLIAALAATLLQPADEPPPIYLPTPIGEPWRVIQGYGCGTHEAVDYYAIDLANAAGPTRHAPVRAAAAGVVLAVVEPSGTLILDHGGYFTQYTHMVPLGYLRRGDSVAVGDLVGFVGERGAPGNPHLHFALFTGTGPGGRFGRHSLPLSFVDGFSLPSVGGCDQHQGLLLVAAGAPGSRLRPRPAAPATCVRVPGRACPL